MSTPCQNQQRGFKKRASSNHDQDGSQKQPKTAEPEENQWPKTPAAFQIDPDPMDPLPAEVAGTGQLTEVAERTWHVMFLWWGTSRRVNSFNSTAEGDNNDRGRDNENGDDDEDDDEDEDEDGRGEDKYEDEDKDKDCDEDEDEDEDHDEDEEGSERQEMSSWDLLGKDFECEATSAMGLSSSFETPTQLTTF